MGLSVSCQDVSVRIQSSRPFPPSLSEIVFDSYRIRPIPTSDGEEAILQFKDEWVEGQMASHPVQEGKLVLSWLGLVLRSRLSAGASEINNVPFPSGESAYRQFLQPIDPPQDLQVLFDKLCALADCGFSVSFSSNGSQSFVRFDGDNLRTTLKIVHVLTRDRINRGQLSNCRENSLTTLVKEPPLNRLFAQSCVPF